MKGQMKRYFNLKGWAMFLSGAFVLSSCAEDEVVEKYAPNTDGESISFSISKANPTWEPDSRAVVESGRQNFVLRSEESDDTLCVSARTEYGFQNVLSRGALVTDKSVVTSFEVFSNFYTQSQPNVSSFYFMKNEQVSDGVNPSKAYYWPPADCNLDFIALAPYKAGRTWKSEDTDGNPIAPQLTYTVDDDVTKHEDLMIAKTDKMNLGNSTNASVPLSFNHILASVQFAFGNMPEGTVKSISISGPLSKTGTYTVGGNWINNNAESVTYTIAADAGVATTPDVNGKKIVNEKIITLPQSFAENKLTLTVVFNDNSAGERTLTAKIPAGAWAQGTTTNYTISITPAYTLEFTEYTEVLDAHYIITTIKFKTDTDWTMSVAENAAEWAYLSKEKSNEGTDTSNKANEITTGQLAGNWSYVQKCNKQEINGTVKQEGVVENVTVYMLLRENITEQNRIFNVCLSKKGNANKKEQKFTQLKYKIIDGFAMERIEDENDSSPFGFAKNIGNVTYKYNSKSGFLAWLISSIVNGWTGFLSFTPANMTINLTTDVSNISDLNSGLTNTMNASKVTITGNQNFLIQQGWYTTDANIEKDDIKTAVQKCIAKNSFGDYKGNNDDSDAPDIPTNIVWYLPAINEMLKIKEQDEDTGANEYTGSSESYWSSSAINDQNLKAYSWYFEATVGVTTARSTKLKIRCARKL